MLQLAQATATLVNNGVKHKPRLVIATQDAISQQPSADARRSRRENLGYKPENVAVVRKAMVGVTQEGTSTRVFAGAGYLSGGKTGTAQAVGMAQRREVQRRQAGRTPARPRAVHRLRAGRRPEDRASPWSWRTPASAPRRPRRSRAASSTTG